MTKRSEYNKRKRLEAKQAVENTLHKPYLDDNGKPLVFHSVNGHCNYCDKPVSLVIDTGKDGFGGVNKMYKSEVGWLIFFSERPSLGFKEDILSCELEDKFNHGFCYWKSLYKHGHFSETVPDELLQTVFST
jgi:hypothetical protein